MDPSEPGPRPNRLPQVVLIATFLPFCWLAMMALHELGHAAAAWATGGTVTKLVVHPLAISRTDVSPNPKPLVVVWAGPLIGILLPLAVWLLFLAGRIPGAYLPRFLAGFCLIANGAYLGVGSFGGVGDAGEMLRSGTPRWAMLAFGGVALALGLALWHRLGSITRFLSDPSLVTPRMTYAALAACATAVLAGLAGSLR